MQQQDQGLKESHGGWRDRRRYSQGKDSWGSCRRRPGTKKMEGCWAMQGRISRGAGGGGRRSSPSIHPWERAFLSSSTPPWYGSPAPLELTTSLPLSVPTHSLPSQQSLLLLTLGAKQPARGEGLAPSWGVRQEYCGEVLTLPLAIPL